MKHLIFTFFLLPFLLNAQQYNYLEGQTNLPIEIDTSLQDNRWQIGPPQKLVLNSASTVPNVIMTDTINNIDSTNLSMFELVVTNNALWYFPMIVLDFESKMETDPNHSGGWIEASYDEGVTWNNIFDDPIYSVVVFGETATQLSNGEIGFTGTNYNSPYFNYMLLCWAPNWNTPTPNEIRIRFYYYADADVASSEGWLIDNIQAYPEITHTLEELEEMASVEETVVTYPNPVKKFLNIFYKIGKAEEVTIRAIGLDGKQYFAKEFKHASRGVFFEIYNEELLAQLPQTFVLITQIGDRIYSNKIINMHGLR